MEFAVGIDGIFPKHFLPEIQDFLSREIRRICFNGKLWARFPSCLTGAKMNPLDANGNAPTRVAAIQMKESQQMVRRIKRCSRRAAKKAAFGFGSLPGKDALPDYPKNLQAEEARRISKAKRAAEELQKSEIFNQAVLDSVFSQIAVLDQNGVIVAVNEAWKRFTRDNSVGPEKSVCQTGVGANYLSICQSILCHSREISLAAYDGIQKVINGHLPSFHLEYDCRSPTRKRWFRMSVTSMGVENGGVVVAHTDITEATEQLRDTKEKLRALAAHQEQMLEQERKGIALEVHDEMGQLLTALNLDLSLVGLRFGDNRELLAMVDKMHVLLGKTIKVVRHVSSNLRPAALDLGLAPAIEWLAEDFSSRWPVRCRLDSSDDDIVLDDLLSTAVFRVIQESLTNVARHANAREVVIFLSHSNQELCVVIEDDGQGFDTTVVGQGSGFGLFGMRERMLALGGTLRIDSEPGKGTTVSIKLPISNKGPS